MVRQLRTGLWHRHETTQEARQWHRHETTQEARHSEAKIVLPESYWPKDKVSWTSQCMDHRENKRVKGNHTFQCVLLESKPRYLGATGGASTYEAELSAWHIRS